VRETVFGILRDALQSGWLLSLHPVDVCVVILEALGFSGMAGESGCQTSRRNTRPRPAIRRTSTIRPLILLCEGELKIIPVYSVVCIVITMNKLDVKFRI